MEEKKKTRKSLKRKIVISITLVVLIAMIISTVISYIYFSEVVQTQVISDERAKMQQLSSQIEFMTEDIKKFSKSIIIDDYVQKVLHTISYDTMYDKVAFEDNIGKRLVFYNSMRTYIWSSYIRLENGTFYGGVSPRIDDDTGKKYDAPKMREYRQNPEWTYSNPYYSTDTIKPGYVVCFRENMLDVTSYGTRQGMLYVEVYLKDFIDQVKNYEKEQTIICLIGNNDEIIYEGEENQIFNTLITELKKSLKTELKAGTYKIKEGYLICEEINGTGWKTGTLITEEYLRERSQSVFVFFLFSFSITIALTLVVTSYLMTNITRPITRLSHQMEEVDYHTLTMDEMVHTNDEIQTLYECYRNMLDEIRTSISERMEYEEQKTKMEFDIMLSQINPHYLYNVLNTVVYLGVAEKNDKIVEIVRSLIYTLQETIKVGEENIESTIEKEIELTEHYLKIQKYRYPENFEVDIQCEERLKKHLVAKTIIQPLVENAILHGIIPSGEKGKIKVHIMEKENKICIMVSDNGIGITEQGVKRFEKGEDIAAEERGRSHIGIRNIKERIQYLYGEPFGMWIRKKEVGTEIKLLVPIKK